jgi:curved DNA-binding protein CbpA
MDPAFRTEVETLAEALDQLDYFAVLKLAATATPGEIRAAYHRESRVYHPDRYAAVDDEGFRDRIGRIYRRINEAYTVLRDDARRKKYAGEVAGPDRARKLRFSEDDEAAVKEAQKKRAVEQLGQTPNGRKFFSAALADAQAGRWEGAERNLKMALAYEPTNERFKELLAQAEKHRPKHDFRIK